MSLIVWKILNGFSRLLFLTAIFFYPAAAQYRFDQWTADTGLPQNSVYSLLQTRDGYLWLATVDGLARFDGSRFTIFNTSNTPGIVNNRFVSLFEDGQGDLWAGTEESGAVRLHNELFSTFGVESGLRREDSFFGLADKRGNPTIMYTSDLKGLHFDGEKFVPYELAAETEISGQKQIKAVYCVFDFKESIFNCDLGGEIRKLKYVGTRAIQWSQARSVMDKNGSIWMPYPNLGLVKYDPDGKMTIYRIGEGVLGTPLFLVPREDGISLLSKDKDGAVWLTNLEGMKSELVSRHPPESFDALTHAYQDSEGSIWAGTLRSGLFRLRKQVITSYSTSQGIWNNNIYPIYQDRRGTVWVGSSLGLFKEKNGTFELVKGCEKCSINAITETPDGRLLVNYYEPEAKVPAGLLVLEQDQLKPFFNPDPLGVELKFVLYFDEEQSLWMGSYNGLVRIKDGVGTFYGEKDGLAGKEVRVIISDGAGGMWMGSYGGLTHYKDGRFQKWTESEGLPARTIRALYLDSEGVLWIGSYDKGLVRFKDGKFTHYSTRNGLYNDGAFQILEDDQRNFWLSSNRGIYRVRKDELNELAEGKRDSVSSISYGKSDGMLNVECNGGRSPGGIRARDGRLWFPTQDGVAVVNPKEVKTNPKPPPVVIESVKIDNNLIADFGLGNSDLSDKEQSQIPNPKSQIQIEPNQQNFEIQYTALSFINSENLRFKYKLEGLDNDWIDTGTRRTAYFSHVPPGDYTFRVIAANSDGIWNTEGAAIKIVIVPPFWRTWWFIALCILAVSGTIYWIWKYRVAQLKRARTIQESFARQLIASQESERKRISAELHDSLGQNLLIVKNRAQLGRIAAEQKAPELLEQFEWIVSSAAQSIEEVREIAQNLRPYHLDRLGLTKALEIMLEKVAVTTGIRFVSELLPLDDLFSKDDAITLYRVVQESLNNIVKHAGATTVRVSVERTTDSVTLTIEDNGQGFLPSDVTAKPVGFGLTGMVERVRMLGGEWRIDSHPGHGTTITMRLTLDNTNRRKLNDW